jgi:uncharacterized protein YqcC (DUF446 family)
MTKKAQQLLFLLDAIETEMNNQGLWAEAPPSDEALNSPEPFCVDTLEFHEWVQWIMVPRFRHMVQVRYPLPSNSDIHPMAEEAFKLNSADTKALLHLIQQVDACLRITH